MKDEQKSCFVAEFGLKTELWQEDLFEKRIFPHADEFQNFLNQYMIGWFKTLFEDEQFKLSWRFPYDMEKLRKLQFVKKNIEESEANGNPLEKRDEAFLAEHDSKVQSISDEMDKCRALYQEHDKDSEINIQCFKYCKSHAYAQILNPKYVKIGRQPSKFSKQGLESLAGNVRTFEHDKSGLTFEHGGVTIGIARGCADRVWAAWDRKINEWKNWGKHVLVNTNSSCDSISFQSAMNCKLNREAETLQLFFKGMRGEDYHMEIPLLVGKNDIYRQRVLSESDGDPLTVTIVRRPFGRRWRYFAQITLEGEPPRQPIKIGSGKVGIDMGPGGFTMYSSSDCRVSDFHDFHELQTLMNRINELQIKMDRSDRQNNPDNYDENGVGMKGAVNVHTHNYLKMKMELGSLKRRARDFVKNFKGYVINHEVLPSGDMFIVEKTDSSAWARKRKVGVGKHGKKKQYGKSVGQFGPSEFVTRLKHSAELNGAIVREVSTQIAATQLDPTTGVFTKHPVEERTVEISGSKVDRDAIAAFNLAHVRNDANVDANVKRKKSRKSSEDDGMKDVSNYDFSNISSEWGKFVESQKKVVKAKRLSC